MVVAHVDDVIADQRLEENANQADQTARAAVPSHTREAGWPVASPRLEVLVFDVVAVGDAVRYVHVNEVRRQLDRRCEPIHHLRSLA